MSATTPKPKPKVSTAPKPARAATPTRVEKHQSKSIASGGGVQASAGSNSDNLLKSDLQFFGSDVPKGTGKKIHGNSLDTPKPTDLYVVRERRTGEIIRFGETTQGYKKRGQQHARRFSKLGIEVETTLLKGGLSKREAKVLETRYIRSYEKIFGNKPPYNKSYH